LKKALKLAAAYFFPLGWVHFLFFGGFTKDQKKLHHGKVMIGSQIENVLEHQGLRLQENESVERLGAGTQ
jgi:hypothetical protein